MRCATCDERIKGGETIQECDFCGKKMHVCCAVRRPDPIDEYMATVLPDGAHGTRKDFCFFCYEARAYIVRQAMIGSSFAKHIPHVVMPKEWMDKYGAILGDWPHEPKALPAQEVA